MGSSDFSEDEENDNIALQSSQAPKIVILWDLIKVREIVQIFCQNG